MTDRELDAAIAEKVMGRTVEGDREMEDQTYFERFGSGSSQRMWQRLPHYSTDRNVAALVLARIEELGLGEEVVLLLHLKTAPACPNRLHKTFSRNSVFALLSATPGQLMEAALAAVGVAPETVKASSAALREGKD